MQDILRRERRFFFLDVSENVKYMVWCGVNHEVVAQGDALALDVCNSSREPGEAGVLLCTLLLPGLHLPGHGWQLQQWRAVQAWQLRQLWSKVRFKVGGNPGARSGGSNFVLTRHSSTQLTCNCTPEA